MMQTVARIVSVPQVPASVRVGQCQRRRLVVVAAKNRSTGPMGFVKEDNSGRSNIFAVEPKNLYVSSPRADRAAQQGLGGTQGLLIVGVTIGIILLITAGIARNPDELDQLQQGATSLRDIANQF